MWDVTVSELLQTAQQARQAQQHSVAELKQQLADLQQRVTALAQQHQPHHWVSADQLPFQVIAIDNLQQSNVVTVRYAQRVIPLAVGDTLAGWTLLSASSTNQVAQFQQGQAYVAINLNQVATQPTRSPAHA